MVKSMVILVFFHMIWFGNKMFLFSFLLTIFIIIDYKIYIYNQFVNTSLFYSDEPKGSAGQRPLRGGLVSPTNYTSLFTHHCLHIIVYTLLFTHYCLHIIVYTLLFSHYYLHIIVYTLLFIHYCLYIIVYTLLFSPDEPTVWMAFLPLLQFVSSCIIFVSSLCHHYHNIHTFTFFNIVNYAR